MKIKILILTILTSVSGMLFISCQSPFEKAKENVKDAKEEVALSKQELDLALKDSVLLFRKEVLARIIANEEELAEFKAKAMKGQEYKSKYEAIIAQLRQKNDDIKTRLNNYSEEGTEMWIAFKEEVYYDMGGLEKAMSNIFVDNKE